MASLNLVLKKPPTHTVLTCNSTVGGVTLNWNVMAGLKTEIWASPTSNFNAASQIAETLSNSYFHTMAAGVSKYFWIRAVNEFNTPGEFYPTGTSELIYSDWVYPGNVFQRTDSAEGSAPWGSLDEIKNSAETSAYVTPSSSKIARIGGNNFAFDLTTMKSGTQFTSIEFKCKSFRATSGQQATVQFVQNASTTPMDFAKSYSFVPAPAPATNIIAGDVAPNLFTNFNAENIDSNWGFALDFSHDEISDSPAILYEVSIRLGFTVSNSGAGVQGTASYISSVDVGSSGNAPTSFNTGGYNDNSTAAITSYNTWVGEGSISFTAPTNGIISIYSFLVPVVSNIVGSSGSINVNVRYRLYDNTLSANVPGGKTSTCVYYRIGPDAVVEKNAAELNINYTSGFAGLLIGGHSYTLYREAQKERSGSMTFDVTMATASMSTSGASYN